MYIKYIFHLVTIKKTFEPEMSIILRDAINNSATHFLVLYCRLIVTCLPVRVFVHRSYS